MRAQQIDIPMIIGGKEIRNDRAKVFIIGI